MYDWNLRLSKKADIWIMILCWAVTIFNGIACFIVYSVFSPYDLYLPDQSALEKGLRGFTFILPIALVITILTLGDRRIAKRNAQTQKLPSDFTPPDLNYKKRNLIRIILISIILFIALPWAFALVGVYISDIPGLNLIFLGAQPYKGLPAVHLGSHHGTWGFQFGIFAVLLSFLLDSPYYMKDKRARSIIAGGIVFLSGYSVINVLEDFLNEQIMKRGIDLLLYDVVKAIYSSILFYPILAGLSILVILLWYQSTSKKVHK